MQMPFTAMKYLERDGRGPRCYHHQPDNINQNVHWIASNLLRYWDTF